MNEEPEVANVLPDEQTFRGGRPSAAANLESLLKKAMEEDDITVVRFLLRRGASVDKNWLYKFSQEGSYVKVKALLEFAGRAFDLRVRMTALTSAILSRYVKVMEELLSVDADRLLNTDAEKVRYVPFRHCILQWN